MPIAGGAATVSVVTGVISLAGQVVNLFKGTASKRQATNQSVCSFWDPILGQNNYPQKFQSWLWAVYRSPKNSFLYTGQRGIAISLLKKFSKDEILNASDVPQKVKDLVKTMEILPGGEIFYKNGLLGTRNANRGASLTNDIIEGNPKIWQELADVLGDKMPDISFWSNYLGWENQMPEADLHNRPVENNLFSGNNDLDQNSKSLLAVLAGALLIFKIF